MSTGRPQFLDCFDPLIMSLDDSAFEMALCLTEHYMDEAERAYKAPWIELLDIPIVHTLLSVQPGVTLRISEEGFNYYEVEDDVAYYLMGACQYVPEAAEMVKMICGSNVRVGAPLPKALRFAASGLIDGSLPLKRRRGAKVSKDFEARSFLYQQAALLVDIFAPSLPLTRNDASEAISACDVVAEAATRRGQPVKYEAVRDWSTHSDHRNFRARSDAISNFGNDLVLAHWGIIRGGERFGVLSELRRMTDRESS